MEKVATPPVPVVAGIAVPLSTEKLTVAPTTPALVSFRVNVAVKVTGPDEPNGTELGLTLLRTSVVGTVEVTVNVLEAVLPVSATPAAVAVTAPVVLFFVPELVAVTATERLQDPPPAIVTALKPTDVAPAAGEKVTPQVVVAEGVEATCTPAGSGSVKATLVKAVVPLGLLMLKLSVEVAPTAMLVGEKDLLMLGGARMSTLYALLSEQVLPPPLVQVGEVMLAVSVMASPVSGVAGAVKWNVSNRDGEPARLVNVPVVASDVLMFPDFVSVQEPLRFVLPSPPLLPLLTANVTVKLDPVASLIFAAVGLLRVTTILMLSVNVFCACNPD